MKYSEHWVDDYKGVRFELVKWELGGKSNWNYYLLIPVAQLPEKIRPLFDLKAQHYHGHTIFSGYSSAPIISGLDWHGGITLFEKEFDAFGKLRGYKMGCDYAHLWDENVSYNLEIVTNDAQKSIDSLLTLIPNLKVRCDWNGKYYDKSNCAPLKRGGYVYKLNAKNNFKYYPPERFAEPQTGAQNDKG